MAQIENMKPHPKPTRPPKGKKHRRGICPQCGFIWETTPAHFPHCGQELDQIGFMSKPYKSKIQIYKMALDWLCKSMVEWRDGVTCVLAEVDGAACSTVPNWGHVIPQGGSAFLVYELSNSFRQCSAHNKIHDKVNPEIYLEWYRNRWGALALKMLKQAQIDNRGGTNWDETDYWNMLIEMSDLYSLRFSFGGASLEDKVEAGFYGNIIREAWIKEGRI